MVKNYRNIIEAGLPKYKEWINRISTEYQNQAISFSDSCFHDVYCLFPKEIVQNIKVIKTNLFPYPPLQEFGLPEIEYWNNMDLAAITYNELIFMKEDINNLSILFHECIHASQIHFLGFDKQNIAYGLFTIYKTYDENPFEKMAYQMEDMFNSGTLKNCFIEDIKEESNRCYIAAMELE